jgi:hypothetical protein
MIMLEGINLISTTTIKEIDFWTFLIITAIAGILTFLGLSLLKVSKEIEDNIENKTGKNLWKILNIVLFSVAFIFCFILEAKALNDCFFNPVYDTQYTITISDEVSYNEFTKEYEVLEYNEKDNTYVIREKENVD